VTIDDLSGTVSSLLDATQTAGKFFVYLHIGGFLRLGGDIGAQLFRKLLLFIVPALLTGIPFSAMFAYFLAIFKKRIL